MPPSPSTPRSGRRKMYSSVEPPYNVLPCSLLCSFLCSLFCSLLLLFLSLMKYLTLDRGVRGPSPCQRSL